MPDQAFKTMAEAQAVEEQKTAAATSEEVKNDTSNASAGGPTLQDYEAVVEQLKKTQEEKENYRKGLLAAKSELKAKKPIGNYEDESDLGNLVETKIREVLLSEKESLAQAKENELVQTLIAKNQEMARALQAQSQLPNASSGSAQAKQSVVSETTWSKEQLDYFKAKGLDPNKVKKNWDKRLS